MVRDRANISSAIRNEIWYFLCNGINTNIVHRDLDLYFQLHKIGNHITSSIWKTVRAGEDCFSRTFMEVDINNRMKLLGMLCTVTLSYISKLIKFREMIYLISGKRCVLAKDTQVQL